MCPKILMYYSRRVKIQGYLYRYCTNYKSPIASIVSIHLVRVLLA